MSAEKEIAQAPEAAAEGSAAEEGHAGVSSRIVHAGTGDVDAPNAPEAAEAAPTAADESKNAVRALVARLVPGTLIDDKYCIQSVIGRGGMGVVMSARHQHLNREVALKFLCMPGGVQEDLRARFRREAQVNAKLKNEHITRVLDVGRWEDVAFIVMERLEGADLRRKMREGGGTIPLHTALNYTLQLCEGIAEAHAHGIVHRDLKPANLFVTQGPDGSSLLKIMDFGISKWKDDEVGELTKDGTILGSPKYMAPEQIFGEAQLDARADVWSIAAICYEMISGRTPYKEPTLARFCAEMTKGPPPPLSSVAQQPVPPALSEVLARCFERDAAKRPQTVAELAGALLEAVDSPGHSLREKLEAILAMRPRTDADVSAPGPSLSSSGSLAPPSGVSHVSSSVITPKPRPNRTPKAFFVAGSALAVLGLLLLGAAFVRNSASQVDTTPAIPASTPAAVVTAPATAVPTDVATTAAPPTAAPTADAPTAAAHASATAAPRTGATTPRLVKPPATTEPRSGATAAAPTPTTKSTKADDDIPTMR